MKKEEKMHARNAGFTKENNLISNWLKEHGDPAIDKLVKCNLAIANRIADIPSKKIEPAGCLLIFRSYYLFDLPSDTIQL